jgi:hypothetical protein
MSVDERHLGCLRSFSSRPRCSSYKDCRRRICNPNGRSTDTDAYAVATDTYTHTIASDTYTHAVASHTYTHTIASDTYTHAVASHTYTHTVTADTYTHTVARFVKCSAYPGGPSPWFRSGALC